MDKLFVKNSTDDGYGTELYATDALDHEGHHRHFQSKLRLLAETRLMSQDSRRRLLVGTVGAGLAFGASLMWPLLSELSG